MSKILIGADPEFFLEDTVTGEYVSAHGLIPGNKKEPHKLEGGAVQLDGTAIEFNIDPAGTPFEFSYNVESVLRQIREMVPKKYKFIFKPAISYKKEVWEKIPDSSKELGCDPDFNAHAGNSPQAAPKPKGTMRTGAGHIHIGWTNKADPIDETHFWDCKTLIQELYFAFSCLTPIWDEDRQRQEMYGNGAVFRPKPYGVEFRTPSNAWLNYPNLWPWIFSFTREMFFLTNRTMSSSGSFYLSSYSYPTAKDKVKGYNNHIAKALKLPVIPDNWNEAIAI